MLTESTPINTVFSKPLAKAARPNWLALTDAIRQALGFLPDDLRLEESSDFTADTQHFGIVVFREHGPSIEAEFHRVRDGRWHCTRHELV